MKRIFVRGMSRSGGTLMATVLDAHPDVAMSYEIYQNLLAPADENDDQAPCLLKELQAATKRIIASRKPVYARIEDPKVRTFAARAGRAGVEPPALLRLLKRHIADGYKLSCFRDRMLFIERIAREKMRREGKQHWGSKIAPIYRDLVELYPDAYILFMLRDGRDIAASRKNVGNFAQPIQEIAGSWCNQIKKFKQWAGEAGGRARIVSYEKLTADPHGELQGIMAFLDLPWDDTVMSFHDQDLTIYRNPTGHLSADQIKKPIFASSVRRWKRDLTGAAIDVFESIAGDTLEELGYEVGIDVAGDA